MPLTRPPASLPVAPEAAKVFPVASVRFDHPAPLRALASQLGAVDLALVVLFISPDADIRALSDLHDEPFGNATVIGCTTAGEISERGYTEGEIVAIGFPRSHFAARSILIEDLNALQPKQLVNALAKARNELAAEAPDWTHEFHFLLIDGMSRKEEEFAVALASGWGPASLFGGSAGDGTRFKTTILLHEGRILDHDAAIVTHIRSACPVRVFKTDHVVPTEQRMVVTGADPSRRLVHEINAEPAAEEYARLVGMDVTDITPEILGSNPVVVRIAGQHYVRGIRNVTEDGSLLFTAAIDEGIVLTLAHTHDIAAHLDRQMHDLTAERPLVGVIACDCLYRRTDAQSAGAFDAVSEILNRHRVFGFSCYGEIFNSMHVNQTLTAVAIYAPDGEGG